MSLCTIPDCGEKHLAKSYCTKHYWRDKKFGSPLAPTRFDRRPARIDGQFAKIPLGMAAKHGHTVVDIEHSNLDKHNWTLGGDGYPVTWISGKLVKLHHLIMGKPVKGKVTDHVNRDKLDNRKNNLRFVSQKVNVRNAGMFSHNTSGHKGVSWDKRSKRWFAQGAFNGTTQFGGYYETIEEAVEARKRLEVSN